MDADNTDTPRCFLTSKHQLIKIPEDFEFYSQTVAEYIQSIENSQHIPIPQDDEAPILAIFNFFDKLRENDQNAYVKERRGMDQQMDFRLIEPSTAENKCDDTTAPKEIDDWAKTFFKAIDKDDLLVALNTANYLGCKLFIDYGLEYLVYHLCNAKMDLRKLADHLNEPLCEDEGVRDGAIYTLKNWSQIKEEMHKTDETTADEVNNAKDDWD